MNGESTTWLDELDCSDPLWLQLLVDDELSPSQRRRLLRHLESHPHRWRECALAFMDEQRLRHGLAESAPADPDQLGNQPTASPSRFASAGRRGLMWGLAVAAGWLLATLAHRAFPPPSPLQSPVARIESSAPPRQAALYQVRDDWDRAEFEVDGVAPRFLLDALLFAGHSISLEQRRDEQDRPVNVMQIQKFGQLLADQ